MTTIRTACSPTVMRPIKGSVLVANTTNPDVFAAIPDPNGELGQIMQVCAARDQRRTKEYR